MLRHLLLLALCVFPAFAIECDKCTGKECFAACFFRQKGRTAEAQAKCQRAEHETLSAALAAAEKRAKTAEERAKTAEASLETAEASLAECETHRPNADDGSAAGVDQCFMDGGGCASCCGACTVTNDLDNSATTGSCVCYEASTAPSGKFRGTNNNDCVFIEAEFVEQIYVGNRCMEGADEVLAPPRIGSRCSGRVESMRP